MAKYYNEFKTLILATALLGIYFPSVEKIYGNKFYTKCLKIFGIVPGLSLLVYLLSIIKFEMFDAEDTEDKIFGCTILVYVSFMNFTFFSFYWTRHKFQRLFELWDSMFQEELFSENRQELLKMNINVTNNWFKRFGFISVLTCVVYCSAVYFIPTKTLTHPSGFPYRHQSPDFELLTTFDLIVAGFGFSGLITFDSTVMAFLSMEEAQFQHLKRSLAWIVDTVSVTESGGVQIKTGTRRKTESCEAAEAEAEIDETHSEAERMERAFEETNRLIRIWITHHQQVLRFHSEFQKAFSVPLAAKFSFFVIIICLNCFISLAGSFSLLDVVFSFVLCCNNYILFYVNVRHADSMAEIGSLIFAEAFGKSWYLYPRDLKTTFYIIQMQSNRPVHYTAFKIYSLSSNGFLKILSSAYSLFTFMLQVNRRKIKMLDLQASPSY